MADGFLQVEADPVGRGRSHVAHRACPGAEGHPLGSIGNQGQIIDGVIVGQAGHLRPAGRKFSQQPGSRETLIPGSILTAEDHDIATEAGGQRAAGIRDGQLARRHTVGTLESARGHVETQLIHHAVFHVDDWNSQIAYAGGTFPVRIRGGIPVGVAVETA